MAICVGINHEHTEDDWSQGKKGESLVSVTLWGKHRAMVEPWRFTGIEPQSRRAHGGRTDGGRLSRKQLGGLSQVGWKGILSVSVNSVPLWLIIVAF